MGPLKKNHNKINASYVTFKPNTVPIQFIQGRIILMMIVLRVASMLSVSVVALEVAARIRTVSKRVKRISQEN